MRVRYFSNVPNLFPPSDAIARWLIVRHFASSHTTFNRAGIEADRSGDRHESI
jgi:hypothetical protein